MPLIIEPAPVPPSAPGIPQPVIEAGESLPPSFPLGSAGTWLPPPLVGDGGNVPFSTPVVPPGTGINAPQQPQFVPPGSATVPASLFPNFTTTPPTPPIVFANIFKIGTVPPPLPSTPGQNPPPIVPSPVPTIPQIPWPPIPPIPPPVNTVRPVVTGTTEVGSNLTTTNGTWTNATTFAIEWTRDGSPIAGAHGTQYALVGADAGAEIASNITATGPGGEAAMDSLSVGPITEAPDPLEETTRAAIDPEPARAAQARHVSKSKRKR